MAQKTSSQTKNSDYPLVRLYRNSPENAENTKYFIFVFQERELNENNERTNGLTFVRSYRNILQASFNLVNDMVAKYSGKQSRLIREIDEILGVK